jgi:hypothetical protein
MQCIDKAAHGYLTSLVSEILPKRVLTVDVIWIIYSLATVSLRLELMRQFVFLRDAILREIPRGSTYTELAHIGQ